ncbi:NAD(P)/FAD-dependent oxidoreductase [Thermosynechococcus sp. TG252]|uniref:NAD(P)/FAD-dependent oxidoreductase n=1 Tax=Thermosynechococcus sp. TG252 TaxID=3074097 RepID=UPI0028648486|nr:NAD(P)/FAD-dependent oxidoreductase [Thermosynechococcus sp. TG252]MDR7992544.1 NAD(P)/FAD-dependent oxidoreductase [Thermosynechococcus sp. TG252]
MAGQRILVIGGGAAGFFGAIACATANSRNLVTILEAGATLLSKVRISGGGRCNVTHHCFDPALLVQHYPRGGKALRGAFSRFQPQDTIAWFEARGVKLKTEADGRVFPVSDDSGTIIDCLVQEATALGIRLRTRAAVKEMVKVGNEFQVTVAQQPQPLVGDRVLLATGSSSQGYRLAAQLGHTIIPPVPSLFTFHIDDPLLQERSGLSVEPVEATLKLLQQPPLTQTGAILVTHWGLSGPVVLKLSAWGARALAAQNYRGTLVVNWLPHLSLPQIQGELAACRSHTPKRAIASHCPFPLPRRLWSYWTTSVGIPAEQTWAHLSKKQLLALAEALHRGTFAIAGKGAFKEEFVTCGGVALKEVDFKTMASRCCEGLFFAGEVLDIDGVTGGFNLQSAWTTGWIAGQGLAEGSTGTVSAGASTATLS